MSTACPICKTVFTHDCDINCVMRGCPVAGHCKAKTGVEAAFDNPAVKRAGDDMAGVWTSIMGWLGSDSEATVPEPVDTAAPPARERERMRAPQPTIDVVGEVVNENTEEKMFCESCGREQRATAKFCPKCGQKVGA